MKNLYRGTFFSVSAAVWQCVTGRLPGLCGLLLLLQSAAPGTTQAAIEISQRSGPILVLRIDEKGRSRDGEALTLEIPPADVGGTSEGYILTEDQIPPNILRIWYGSIVFEGPFEAVANTHTCTTVGSTFSCEMGVRYNATVDPGIGKATVSYIDFNSTTGKTTQGYFTVNLSSYVQGPRDIENECTAEGSVIGISDQTLGESVGIVGADFTLNYASENSPNYDGAKLDLAPAGGFNIGGWNPSIHHFYSMEKRRLFKGNGAVVSAGFGVDSRRFQTVAETDAQEMYLFDYGRHVETRDAFSGAILYTFQYSGPSRLLSSITDRAGNVTSFSRDSNGLITSITNPYGKVTALASNSAGLYSSITSPGGKVHSFTYKAGTSLLESFTKPGGQAAQFTYDSLGRLIRDQGAGGNYWDLVRSGPNLIKQISALGTETSFDRSFDQSGRTTTAVTSPSGLATFNWESVTGATASENPIMATTTTLVRDARFRTQFQRLASRTVSIEGVNSTTQISQAHTYPANPSHNLNPYILGTNTRTETVLSGP